MDVRLESTWQGSFWRIIVNAFFHTLMSKINGPPRLLIFQKISHPPPDLILDPPVYLFSEFFPHTVIFLCPIKIFKVRSRYMKHEYCTSITHGYQSPYKEEDHRPGVLHWPWGVDCEEWREGSKHSITHSSRTGAPSTIAMRWYEPWEPWYLGTYW